jgi:hypothetical protein
MGCMGAGRAQWWAINVVEGREVRFAELLPRIVEKTGAALTSDEEADEGIDWREGGAGGLPADAIGGEDDPIRVWLPRKVAQVGAREGCREGAGRGRGGGGGGEGRAGAEGVGSRQAGGERGGGGRIREGKPPLRPPRPAPLPRDRIITDHLFA